jgi:hypothetical protein
MKTAAHLREAYGWPPRLVMYLACIYTGRTRWTLARAVRSGALPVAGRNGRSAVFDRRALDTWMVGGCSTVPAVADGGATKPTGTSAQRPGRASAALERIRAIARGGQP